VGRPALNVEMPDGTIIEDVPDGTPKDAIYAKWKAAGGQEPRTSGDNLARGIGLSARSLVTAASSIPGMVGDAANALANYGFGGLDKVNSLITGKDAPIPRYGLASEAVQEGLTSAGLPRAETAAERLVYEDIAPAALNAGGIARIAETGTGKLAKILASNPGTQTVAGAAAGASGGTARELGAGPWGQLAAALAGGFMAPAAMEVAAASGGAAIRGVKQLTKPFTEAGRDEVVGSALNRIATDKGSALRNLEDVPEYVPGSKPTTAQGSRDLGLLQAERALEAKDSLFASRKVSNNAARNDLLDELTGTKSELAKAESARAGKARELYDEAFSERPRNTPEVSAEIQELQKRPAFQEALNRAKKMLLEEGDDVSRVGGKRSAAERPGLNTDSDNIEQAVRKLGGLNPNDEAIGSLAKDMNFANSVDGPVFARQKFGGASNRTHTTEGHALDTMTQKLYDKGYVSSPNAYDEVIEKLYDHSRNVGEHYSQYRQPPSVDDRLIAALDRNTDAKLSKPAEPVDLVATGPKLAHYTKLALDDMIEQAGMRGQKNEQRVLLGTRDKLVNLIERDDFSPGYKRARETYAEMSKPVDQLEAGQQIRKDTRGAGTDTGGNRVLSPAKWQTRVMDRLDDLGEKLSPEQVQKAKAIGADLDRAALSDTAGRAVGSNTFQNLSSANLLGAALGDRLAGNSVALTIARPLQWLYKLPETQVQDLLTQAMLDPSLARALMAKATRPNVEFLAEALKFKFRAMGQGATVGATQREEE
jgi:hypothetical protein